jgi:ribonucleoside-diphosphate reductase alpha chain
MTYEKFYWLNDDSRTFLSRGYLNKDETAEGRIREIADKAEWYLKDMAKTQEEKYKFDGFADKFFDYMSRGYYSLSSPVWANYGKDRGLPVSCFGSYIDDNMESILYGVAENGMLMKNGGGCSGYFGAVRPRGAPIKDQGESSGSVHFMQMYDTLASVVSQGSVRRGFFAAYQDIEHPDADEFLDIGTEGNPIQGLTTSVVVSDEFLEAMKEGDPEKRRLWAKVLQRRSEIGFPYIMFSGNVNKNKPQVYLDKNMKIHASQMCSEIALPSTVDETFTCVLSSLNLLHWDEIKDTDAIEVLTMFLDTVNEEFVRKSEGQEYLKRARQFAEQHRALGAGVLGWHSYLQSKMIAFESQEAADLNRQIAETFKERSHSASRELAVLLGEAPVLKGYGMRNTTTMAIAPTKSSSFILGQVSQSIEPEFSNCYVKDLAKMKVTIKNPFLQQLLKQRDMDNDEVWESIKIADGSVQHLDFLTEDEKAVFKTFSEIDPYTIVEQAADRQKYIDQSQSLNLMLDPDMSVKEINALYLYAHQKGIKNLYYAYSMSKAQSLTRKKLTSTECAACEA